MPTFDQEKNDMMDVYNTKGIVFSGVRPDKLESTSYSLATILRDTSGSVSSFEKVLVKSTRDAVRACTYSDYSNNMLIRCVDFNSDIREIHGFKELKSIDIDNEYDIFCSGTTALHDAVINGVESTRSYAKTLFDQDFDVNAIIFVLTDGEENASNVHDVLKVKEAVDDLLQSEVVQSCIIILIGVNAGRCSAYLKDFQKKVNISEYIDIADFDHKKGAKLAQFVSKSISSQSQSLVTGSPSQVLTFN